MTFAPTTKVGYEGGLAHDREILQRMKRYGACDGDGLTARPTIPQAGLPNDVLDISNKSQGKNKKILSTGVLLLGGAVIGYCLKGPIGNCIKGITDKCGKFFSEGKPAEILGKVKNAVFCKK